jgi:hypothetical protein
MSGHICLLALKGGELEKNFWKMKKLSMTQHQKHVGFKKAFDTYKHYLSIKNFVGAYVVAFSFLEDRISLAYVLLKDIQKEERPKPGQFVNLTKKLSFLSRHNQLTFSEFDVFKQIVHDRNEKLHEAMWNLDTFNEEACTSVINLGRKADTIAKKLKKTAPQNV